MTKKIFATIAMTVIATLTICTNANASTNASVYPATMIVTEVNETENIITLSTASGITYQYEGIEDWCEGDIAGLIMDDNGTSDIHDDIIVDVRYTGYTEAFEQQLK